MYLTDHARQRISEYFPDAVADDVLEIIGAGGVTVSSSIGASDLWQTKEFRVFWFAASPWVAICDLKTKACLTVIPAWRDDMGIGLYEDTPEGRRIVAFVNASHIRRSFRASGETGLLPEQFISRRFTLSARTLFRSGRVRVTRLGRFEGDDEALIAHLKDPESRRKWLALVEAASCDQEIRESVLSAKRDRYSAPIEEPLIESVSAGGW